MSSAPPAFPDDKRFAFAIFDDCDNSTVENTRPFYELLDALGLRTTRTVWCLDSADVHPNWRGSSTLEDPRYRDLALELQTRGFEIAFHGASMMSSVRERTIEALERFRETFGHDPRAHANHGSNRDNLYWGALRFRTRLLRLLYRLRTRRNVAPSEGERADSPYFWGDVCRQRVRYVRSFTFPRLNLRSLAPRLVYHDPETEHVSSWFLASHAANAAEFNRLLQPQRQATLECEGGVAIVATHVASGFVRDGVVNPETRRLLEMLARRSGWFVPVSTLLDHLRAEDPGAELSRADRLRIELLWAWHASRRGIGH